MANATVKDAVSIKGTNPQYLVEKIIRTRIYDARYWKEECFGLTAELLVDKAIELKSVGGIYGGNTKPTPFLCLILKMLQIQPEKDIIIEFIRNEDFKYVRALGAFYMRLTGDSLDVYKYLEPLYIDYRKMKRMNRSAKYELTHMDEIIDEMLHADRLFDITLPRIQKRQILEENNELEPRVSPLEVDLDEADSSSSEEEDESEEEVKEKRVDKEKKRRSGESKRRGSSVEPDSDKEERHRRDRHKREKEDESTATSSKSKKHRSRSRSRDRERRDRDRHRDERVVRNRSRTRSRDRDRDRSTRDHRDKDRHRHRQSP